MYMHTIWKQLSRVYRRQKISKGQSKQDNSERQEKNHKNTICIGHHYAQANTNNVNNKKDCKIQVLK